MSADTPLDLAEIQRLLAVISPLPYWIEPAQPTLLHGYPRTLDAYIACGTRGDPSDTYDVIERYDVDTDYAYLVAAANVVPALIQELTTLRARVEQDADTIEDLQDDLKTLGSYLIAIKEPEAILVSADHPNGATPAMRALRTAVEQRDTAQAEVTRLASALAGVRDLAAPFVRWLDVYEGHMSWMEDHSHILVAHRDDDTVAVVRLGEIRRLCAALRGTGEAEDD